MSENKEFKLPATEDDLKAVAKNNPIIHTLLKNVAIGIMTMEEALFSAVILLAQRNAELIKQAISAIEAQPPTVFEVRGPNIDARANAIDMPPGRVEYSLEMVSYAIPPRYNFPPAIFVESNTAAEQLDHIFSEIDEIAELGPQLDTASNHYDAKRVQLEIDREMVDALHSIETRLRILEKERGREYVNTLFRTVREKNAARGYYAVPWIDPEKDKQADKVAKECGFT